MIGCLLGLILMPYRLIKWGFTSGIKGIITLVIVAVLVLVLILVGRLVIMDKFQDTFPDTFNGGSESQGIELDLPGSDAAPYQVVTTSRTYYAATAVQDTNGDVTMVNYWELKGKKWVKTEGVLDLEADTYGRIQIIERK